MAFELDKPTECSACSTERVRDNVLSPAERLIICNNFLYCPYCGRQLMAEFQITRKENDA